MSKKDKNKSVKEHSIFSNFIYVYKYVWKYKKSMLILTILWIASCVSLNYIWNFTSKFIIDDVMAGASVSSLIVTLIIAGAISAVTNFGAEGIDYLWWPRAHFITFKFVTRYNQKFMTMRYEHLERPEILDKAEKAKKAADWGGSAGFLNNSKFFMQYAVNIIVSAVIICTLNPMLLLVFTATGLLKAYMNVRTKKEDKRLCWDNMAPFNRKLRYLGQVQSDFSFAKDIRIYNMRSFLKAKHTSVNNQAHKLFIGHKNRWLKWEMKNYVVTFFETFFQYGYLIFMLVNGNLELGNFVLYSTIINNYTMFLRTTFVMYSEMKQNSMEIDDFRDFVDDDSTNDVSENTKPVPKADSYEIEFKNVSFKYYGKEKYALKNLSLKLTPGKTLAIVGLNGAGKSTFIKLLCRIYDVTEGQILLNGVDVREYDRLDYFKIFSPVFQNVEMFALNLGENVAMRPDKRVESDKAVRVLNASGLRDKLKSMKDGLKTQMTKVIYDEGIDLSGGEKQKLSLAKALYKDAPIVLLDEPTAALDPLAEYELYQSFDEIIKGKTAVYISHRLSSTRFCDNIAMFENGSLIEYGTHESLLKSGGAYAHLFEVQAQYYKEEQKKKEMEAYESEVAFSE